MGYVIDELPGVAPGEFFVPSNKKALADQTTTTASQALGVAAKTFMWYVWMKAFTHGNGTVGPIFVLQVADDTNFSTNLREIGMTQIQPASSTSSLLGSRGPMYAACPDGSKAFARIVVVFSGSDSGSYDALIRAA